MSLHSATPFITTLPGRAASLAHDARTNGEVVSLTSRRISVITGQSTATRSVARWAGSASVATPCAPEVILLGDAERHLPGRMPADLADQGDGCSGYGSAPRAEGPVQGGTWCWEAAAWFPQSPGAFLLRHAASFGTPSTVVVAARSCSHDQATAAMPSTRSPVSAKICSACAAARTKSSDTA
jgi:hypothetical protein